jgi:hydroxyacylglutathione hydrolase
VRIQTIPCLSDNLSYLVIDEVTRTCVAIDTGEARPFLDAIREQSLRLVAILTTHHHYDHIGALSQFPEVPVWSSKRDLERVPGAGKSQVRYTFEDGNVISWGELAHDPSISKVPIKMCALAIPGHTEGQTALIFSVDAISPSVHLDASPSVHLDASPSVHLDASPSVHHVFVGDTLFAFGCGRCLEGTPETLFESLQKIKALPKDARLYFGHEYTEKNSLFWLSHVSKDSALIDGDKIKRALMLHGKAELPKPAPTLAEELDLNPFLKIKNASEFRRWRELRNQF